MPEFKVCAAAVTGVFSAGSTTDRRATPDALAVVTS
jgi:hypothetical protein